MMKVILIVIAMMLSMFGLSELLHKIWMSVIRPGRVKNIIITPLSDSAAAEQIAAVLEEMRWLGKNYADALIGVDLGIDAETAEKCRTIEKNCSDFVFCMPRELGEIISKRS